MANQFFSPTTESGFPHQHFNKFNPWHLFAAYSHVTLCAKDSSKRKLLRQEALAEEGGRGGGIGAAYLILPGQ